MAASLAVWIAWLACAFIPGTRASVRNNLRYLSGNWYEHTVQYTPSHEHTFASGALDPDTWRAKTRTSQLAAAIERNHRELTNSQGDDPPLRSLELYCDNHPDDTEAWAHLARLACQGCSPTSDSSKLPSGSFGRWNRFRTLQLKASEAGMRLEPANAYFLLIHAGASLASSDGRIALADFFAASNAKFFRDYSMSEAKLLQDAVQENHGDVTATDKFRIRIETLFPHFAGMKGLAKAIAQRNANRASDVRIASCRIGALIMDSHETLIGSLVGGAIIQQAIKMGGSAQQLDAMEGRAIYASYESRALAVKQAAAQPNLAGVWPDDKAMLEVEGWRPKWSTVALAMMLAAWPIALGVAFGARKKLEKTRHPGSTSWVSRFILVSLIGVAGLLVAGASFPSPHLLVMLGFTVLTCTALGTIFTPAGQVDPNRTAAIAVIACALLYSLLLAADMRVESRADGYVSAMEQRERAVLNSQ